MSKKSMSSKFTFHELIAMYKKRQHDSIQACRQYIPLRLTAHATVKPVYKVVDSIPTPTTAATDTAIKITAATVQTITAATVQTITATVKNAPRTTATVTTGLYTRADIIAARIAIDDTPTRARKKSDKTEYPPLNIFNYPDDIITAARVVGYITAKNAIMRDGTPTQYDIYNAFCRREFTHPDAADIISVAINTFCECVYGDAEKIRREIAVLKQSVDMLKPLNLTVDYLTVKRIVTSGAKHTSRITDDWRKNAAAANMLSYVLTAHKKNDSDAAFHAAFLAVNQYLSSMRTIHADRHGELSLSDMVEYYTTDGTSDIINRIEHDTEKTARRRAALSAFSATMDRLTKSQKTTYKLLIRGYTVAQISRRRKLSHSTICEHKNTIAAAYMDAAAAVGATDKINIIAPDAHAATVDKCNELSKIRAAVNNDMKLNVQWYISQLADTDAAIFAALIRGDSIRAAAVSAGISKSRADRIKTRIIIDILDIVERRANIKIEREKLNKIPVADIMSIFA